MKKTKYSQWYTYLTTRMQRHCRPSRHNSDILPRPGKYMILNDALEVIHVGFSKNLAKAIADLLEFEDVPGSNLKYWHTRYGDAVDLTFLVSYIEERG